jgi:hypothetical protein
MSCGAAASEVRRTKSNLEKICQAERGNSVLEAFEDEKGFILQPGWVLRT